MKFCSLFLIFIMLFGCNKSGIPLGKNGYYFCCNIDGNKFEQRQTGGLFSDSPFAISLSNDSKQLNIRAFNFETGEDVSLFISDSNGINSGDFLFSENENGAMYDNTPTGGGQFNTNPKNVGKVTIHKIDFKKRLVEGVFEFTAVHTISEEMRQVTNGKFSVEF